VSAFFLVNDYYIINVCEKVFADLVFEYGLCHSAKGWSDVFQAFGHSYVAIRVEGCDEICFLLVFFPQPNLMIAIEIV
jgi:hypothetical protein